MTLTESSLALAIIIGSSAVGSAGCPPPPPMDPVPTATCAETCAHLEDLGCDEAKPSPAGESCVAICENVMASGGLMYWNLDCRVAVSSCDDIDACED